MPIIKSLISIVCLCMLIWVLNSKIGPIPPLGKILSPSEGFWQNAEPKKVKRQMAAKIEGIATDVVVKYDQNHVPHIFSDNEHDLYFAQGYITAVDRLWQMEMQARMAAGRLAEIFGNAALRQDIFYRRLGVPYSAGLALDSVLADPATKLMLESYSEGVNAYIKTLNRSTYPIEFKMFDIAPEKWKPINSILILKMLGERLTGGEQEFVMTNGLMQMGADSLSGLIGRPLDRHSVIPAHSPWNFDRAPASVPSPPDANKFAGRIKNDRGVIGSNTWVVDGKKTRSGYPILANDPHLGLSLPEIWYQVQMKAPGLNVYGVSVPGIPCVMIGYNQRIAWGLTNTMADVVDWYHIKFKDGNKQEYWYNGSWTKVDKRVEKIYSSSGKVIKDTICYTRHGPVVYDGKSYKNKTFGAEVKPDEGFSMNWVLHRVSNDLKAFYLLNRADNYDDFRKALVYLSCPAQNISFASSDNDIAVVCDGKFPLRYRDQGNFILDGSLAADDWHGWVPMDQVPFVKNPARGYIYSANQTLTDSTYPYYLGGTYAADYRAKRIDELLSSKENFTVDSFRLMQLDCYSELAAEVLPDMLRHLKGSGTPVDDPVLDQIAGWDYRYTSNSIGATIFDTWWKELYFMVWKREMDHYAVKIPIPDFQRTVEMIKGDSVTHLISYISAGRKDALNDLVAASFLKAMDTLKMRNGEIGQAWSWGKFRLVSIPSGSRIESFGIAGFGADGVPNTINALTDRFGPSWRMVVELGPHVKGYGILPGGQSGNPGSFYYEDSFSKWLGGRLEELVFLDSQDQNNDKIVTTLILKR